MSEFRQHLWATTYLHVVVKIFPKGTVSTLLYKLKLGENGTIQLTWPDMSNTVNFKLSLENSSMENPTVGTTSCAWPFLGRMWLIRVVFPLLSKPTTIIRIGLRPNPRALLNFLNNPMWCDASDKCFWCARFLFSTVVVETAEDKILHTRCADRIKSRTSSRTMFQTKYMRICHQWDLSTNMK